jgi:DNA topoisomerase VI subunit B
MASLLQRETFSTSRLLDFFSEKELAAQCGHARSEWPLVVAKELIDNALDAAEDAAIAPPAIDVVVDGHGSVSVSDNGPGLPPETVRAILDFSVRVSSRAAYVSPTRGAQGNALKTILAMPFVLDRDAGFGVHVFSKGVHHEIKCRFDPIRQEPVIDHNEAASGFVKNGTSICVEWPDSASSILENAKARFLQIAESFAWLNPHLTLTLD